MFGDGKQASDCRSRNSLLATKPNEGKPLTPTRSLVFDGQFVGLGSTELQDFGGLVDGQEERKFVKHEYVLSEVEHLRTGVYQNTSK